MAFHLNLNDLKSKAQDLRQSGTALAQTGAAKARTMAAVAKLKAANLGEEETLRRAYIELGKLYFEKYGAAPEVEFLNACATIDEARAKIDINNAQIEALLAEDDDAPSVVVVEEATAEPVPATEGPADAEDAADPLADLDAFIEKANAEPDCEG